MHDLPGHARNTHDDDNDGNVSACTTRLACCAYVGCECVREFLLLIDGGPSFFGTGFCCALRSESIQIGARFRPKQTCACVLYYDPIYRAITYYHRDSIIHTHAHQPPHRKTFCVLRVFVFRVSFIAFATVFSLFRHLRALTVFVFCVSIECILITSAPQQLDKHTHSTQPTITANTENCNDRPASQPVNHHHPSLSILRTHIQTGYSFRSRIANVTTRLLCVTNVQIHNGAASRPIAINRINIHCVSVNLRASVFVLFA